MHDFLRDKFTAHALYLSFSGDGGAPPPDLRPCAARRPAGPARVQCRARPHGADIHSGVQLGLVARGLDGREMLSAALRQMEKAYLDENAREYQLTKQISLRQHFPAQFLQLRLTGRCEIEIPEWMFDLDFPGHYLRRIGLARR